MTTKKQPTEASSIATGAVMPPAKPLGTKMYQRYQYGTAVAEVTVVGVLYHVTRSGVKVSYDVEGSTYNSRSGSHDLYDTAAAAFASFARK